MKTFQITLPLVALSLALPATPASAQAPVVPSVGHHDHHYDVYFRDCFHSPWQLHGTYGCREEADRAAHHLEHRGFRTRVRSH